MRLALPIAIGAIALVLVVVLGRRGAGGAASLPDGDAPATHPAADPNAQEAVQAARALPAPAEAVGDAPDLPRRAALEPGPRGRVTLASTGEPLAGIAVAWKFAGGVLQRTTTGSDGRFALPGGDPARGRIVVDADGWRVLPRSHRVDDGIAAGNVAVDFELERVVAAPLRGILLDRRTGEAVPAFSVMLDGLRGRHDRIVTDADGRFVSGTAFESGAIQIVAID
jgi:hypothetical protein